MVNGHASFVVVHNVLALDLSRSLDLSRVGSWQLSWQHDIVSVGAVLTLLMQACIRL
jgi:hypothetical protein